MSVYVRVCVCVRERVGVRARVPCGRVFFVGFILFWSLQFLAFVAGVVVILPVFVFCKCSLFLCFEPIFATVVRTRKLSACLLNHTQGLMHTHINHHQDGVIVYPTKALHLCNSVTDAVYATTTGACVSIDRHTFVQPFYVHLSLSLAPSPLFV